MASNDKGDSKNNVNENEEWYSGGANYWKDVEPSVDGMLGGFGWVSTQDSRSSLLFLKKLKNNHIIKIPLQRALDCGAGIGRVSKETLVRMFDTVDMVEQNGEFLKQAEAYMGVAYSKIGNMYPEGLQSFAPQTGYYSVIWMQWVTGYLTDDDFVSFLERCKTGLQKGGLICIKDNISKLKTILDEDDNSVTRTHDEILAITTRADLKLRLCLPQKNFPKELFSVTMYAFSPSP